MMRAISRWAAVAALAGVSMAAAAQEPFPDEWFFYGAERPAELRALEGQKASEIAAAEWRGDETSLAKLKGKVVVLDFWATWCGPCMAAIPKNVALVDKYKEKGLAFIGMHDSNAGWDTVDNVIADKSINYPVALDDAGKSTKAYNLKFWPTYVLIDRSGTIRAAGLSPDRVEDALKVLLAEPYEGMPAAETANVGFPNEWFFGGEKRPSWLREVEGKPLKAIDAAAWMGDPLEKKAWERRVLVVQFVRPEFGPSLEQLEALAPAQEKFTKQGVVFLAMCDARGDWERMQKAAGEREVTMPLAWDAPGDGEEGVGKTGKALGVRFTQPLAVVDRAGVIRAVGLRPEYLERVINTLLAERLPSSTEPPAGQD